MWINEIPYRGQRKTMQGSVKGLVVACDGHSGGSSRATWGVRVASSDLKISFIFVDHNKDQIPLSFFNTNSWKGFNFMICGRQAMG